MKEVITSKDNKYIKLVRSLDKKKSRLKEGLFMIEGVRNCYEALTSDANISFLLVKESKCENPEIAKLIEMAEDKNIRVIPVEDRIFATAGNTEESQGIIVVAEIKDYSVEEFLVKVGNKKLAVLDGLQDPGNVGTILRTAWAADIGGIILVNNSADLYNPKVVRSTMGAIYNVPFIRLENQAAIELLKKNNYTLAVADAGGEDYRKFNAVSKKVAWLLGSEGNGVSDFWREKADVTLSIPMAPNVESLNVAIAAGILFFSGVDFK